MVALGIVVVGRPFAIGHQRDPKGCEDLGLEAGAGRHERSLWPVAVLVQSIGESCGSSVVMLPLVPDSTSRATPGRWPASMSGCMSFQSAESQPTKSSRWRDIGQQAWRKRCEELLSAPV